MEARGRLSEVRIIFCTRTLTTHLKYTKSYDTTLQIFTADITHQIHPNNQKQNTATRNSALASLMLQMTGGEESPFNFLS